MIQPSPYDSKGTERRAMIEAMLALHDRDYRSERWKYGKALDTAICNLALRVVELTTREDQ